MKMLAAVLILFSFVSTSAFADLFIEPWVGYEGGSYKLGAAGGAIQGSNIGVRLGAKELGFSVGPEYSFAFLTEKPTSGQDLSQDSQDLGLFVGFNLPVMFRFYGSYFLTTTAKVEATTGTYTGTGYRLGVGFTSLPFVVLNVEYISRDYSRISGSKISGGDLTNSSICFNVSLPLP